MAFAPGAARTMRCDRWQRSLPTGTQWVVEADIKGFFEHVSHTHLMRFLEQRIADPKVLRLIQRFLKAGRHGRGCFTASEEGTPQGGLVSPVLSNIYLHYVLTCGSRDTCQGMRGQGVPDPLR